MCGSVHERERVSFLVTFLRTKENFLVVLTPSPGEAPEESDCTWPHIVTMLRGRPRNSRSLAAALTTELVGAWFLGLLSRNCVNPVSPPQFGHTVIPTNSRYQGQRVVSLCAQSYLVKSFLSYRIWSLPKFCFSVLEIWVFIKMV